MKYTPLQKKNFIDWYMDAAPEEIEKAKATNSQLYEELRLEFAAEVIRIDGFKAGLDLAMGFHQRMITPQG